MLRVMQIEVIVEVGDKNEFAAVFDGTEDEGIVSV